MLRLAPLLFVTLAASPALAGGTPWQDIALGVKARLISADKLSDGTTLAGLQLDMPATFGAITATPDGFATASTDSSIDPKLLIANVGDPAILFETPQKSPDSDLWTVRLLGGAAATGLEGRGIQLTFMTPSGPYAVSSTIAAPAR